MYSPKASNIGLESKILLSIDWPIILALLDRRSLEKSEAIYASSGETTHVPQVTAASRVKAEHFKILNSDK